MNSAMITSSKEVMKANNAPEATPGATSGRMTEKKVAIGRAPRLAEARTSRRSNPRNAALTVITT